MKLEKQDIEITIKGSEFSGELGLPSKFEMSLNGGVIDIAYTLVDVLEFIIKNHFPYETTVEEFAQFYEKLGNETIIDLEDKNE